MALIVERLLNHPVDSNCYIIRREQGSACVIVDPAQGTGTSLLQYLSEQNLRPDYIILTHEHFDHISSVECLRTAFSCKVVATAVCSERIPEPKKNLSLFYDQIGFSCRPADLVIEEDNASLDWEGETLFFLLTPGHTEGGLCFNVGEHLFTGDTLMNGHDAVTKLPGGNKVMLQESIKKIFDSYSEQTILYPGHGEVCWLHHLKAHQYLN